MGFHPPQGGGAGITSLVGDVTAVGPGAAAATIANGAVTNVKVAAGIDAVKIADGSVTNAEFQFLGTVTSDIQAQLNNKQPLDATLTSIAALGTAADRVAYTTGVDTWAETPITGFARTILDDADAAAVRATIGAGTGTGTIIGSTGATDNRLIRADGAGGITIQNGAVNLDDFGQFTTTAAGAGADATGLAMLPGAAGNGAGAADGGLGGDVTLQGSNGGTTGTGLAGTGGIIYGLAGNGGNATSVGGTPGDGGAPSLIGGSGGNHTAGGDAGNGGETGIISGAGGTSSAAGGVANNAGNAGNVVITAGSGGNASNGTTNNGGDGGNIILTAGSAGTGATANGAAGTVNVNSPLGGTYLISGTYTPTLTNVANLAASTAYVCQYMRVGTVVTVSGKVDIDPTLAATSTQLGISLPIASNLATAEQCAGTAFASGIAAQGAAILGDAGNNRAQLQYVSSDVSNQPMYFNFQYQII